MTGMKRHDLELEIIRRINEDKASVGPRESPDEFEARLLIYGICTDELFGTPEIQNASESGDATDLRGDAP